MPDGWEWIDQGTDEIHVYRRTRAPHYELHGYRLNRCGWLWQVTLGDELAGRKEHDKLEDAVTEADRLVERDRLRRISGRTGPQRTYRRRRTRSSVRVR